MPFVVSVQMSEIKGEEEFDYPGLLCSLHSLHLYQIMVNSEISNFKREFTFTFSILSSAATKAIFKNKSHRISWFGGLFRIRRGLANRFRTNHPQDQNTTKYCRSITGVRISLLLIRICLAQNTVSSILYLLQTEKISQLPLAKS